MEKRILEVKEMIKGKRVEITTELDVVNYRNIPTRVDILKEVNIVNEISSNDGTIIGFVFEDSAKLKHKAELRGLNNSINMICPDNKDELYLENNTIVYKKPHGKKTIRILED